MMIMPLIKMLSRQCADILVINRRAHIVEVPWMSFEVEAEFLVMSNLSEVWQANVWLSPRSDMQNLEGCTQEKQSISKYYCTDTAIPGRSQSQTLSEMRS